MFLFYAQACVGDFPSLASGKLPGSIPPSVAVKLGNSLSRYSHVKYLLTNINHEFKRIVAKILRDIKYISWSISNKSLIYFYLSYNRSR